MPSQAREGKVPPSCSSLSRRRGTPGPLGSPGRCRRSSRAHVGEVVGTRPGSHGAFGTHLASSRRAQHCGGATSLSSETTLHKLPDNSHTTLVQCRDLALEDPGRDFPACGETDNLPKKLSENGRNPLDF